MSSSIPQLESLIKKKLAFEPGKPCALTKTLHIGYGINTLFVLPAGVSITSVAANNPDMKLVFHILADSIKEPDLERLSRLPVMYPNISVKVYFIDNSFFASMPMLLRFSIAAYYRLMLPLLLEGTAERVLYLDADILCLRSLNELIKIDMEQSVLYAVRDVENTESERVAGLQLHDKHYFNSGVLLINIHKWNGQNVLFDILTLLSAKRAKDFQSPDQDALNITLNGKVKFLKNRWNLMLNDQQRAVPDDTVFLHFVSTPKPWSIRYEGPNQHFYSNFITMSPWAGIPLELPSTYRETRLYARQLLKKKQITAGLHWYLKYILKRIIF